MTGELRNGEFAQSAHLRVSPLDMRPWSFDVSALIQPTLPAGVGMLRAHRMIESKDIARLFDLHAPAVFRRCRRLLGNNADAEEAVQEIFVRVVRAGHTFQHQSQLTTWLYQITTNFCLNQLRDRKRQRELGEANLKPMESAVQQPTADALTEVRRLLARADPKQAEAAAYVFLDGMSHDEAAQVMNVSRRTVGNLIERFNAWATGGEPS